MSALLTICDIRKKWMIKGNVIPPALWVREEELEAIADTFPPPLSIQMTKDPNMERWHKLDMLEKLRAGKVELIGFCIFPVFKYEDRYATTPTLEEQAK